MRNDRFRPGLAIFTIVAIIVVFAAGVYVGNSFNKQQPIEVPSSTDEIDLKLPGETEKMVVTIDKVEAKIKEIGELSTIEGAYHVTKGEDFVRYFIDDIVIPGTKNHVEIDCDGRVKAGYNLEDIKILINDDKQIIYITLPEVQINSNEVFFDDSMLLTEKNNILHPIDSDEWKQLISSIKEEGLEKAKEEGLYEKAEENAKTLIENFLGCFNEYSVEFL